MNVHQKAPNFKNPSALIAACEIRGGTFCGRFPAEKSRRVLLASHELGLNGAPIVLLYLARRLRRLGWQPVLISPAAGPLLDTLLQESFPVLICPSLPDNDVLPRAAGLFRFVVLNTLVFARAAAALNGSDTSVLWWLHEAEACQFSKTVICSEHTGMAALLERDHAGFVYGGDDPAELAHCIMQVLGQNAEDISAMRERARSFYLSHFSIALFDRRLETEILPKLLGGKPQAQPLQSAETPKQMTTPLGFAQEVISRAIKPYVENGLLRKGLYSLRTDGFRMTWQKAMRIIRHSGNFARIAKQAA